MNALRLLEEMAVSDLKYWVALSSIDGIGSRTFYKLTKIFGDPRQLWDAGEDELRRTLKRQPRLLSHLLQGRAKKDPDDLLEKLNISGVKAIFLEDIKYPVLLKRIFDPPPVLYYKGRLPEHDALCVAIVGTRRPSPYGCRCSTDIAYRLASAGCNIVSGMALGIDTLAHKGALQGGGYTTAILGCGPDVVYPRQNSLIYDKITEVGAVVSEYFPGTKPVRGNFPARNRIISGLSCATIVIQAGRKSGASITADFALEQGRPVYAVPGEIYSPTAYGTNKLISDGAVPVFDLDELIPHILYETEWLCRKTTSPSGSDGGMLERSAVKSYSNDERIILETLHSKACHIDDIAKETGLTISCLSSLLSMLELKGMVKRYDSGIYCIIPNSHL